MERIFLTVKQSGAINIVVGAITAIVGPILIVYGIKLTKECRNISS